MTPRYPFLIASFCCFLTGVSATPIVYEVTVNTSSISGTSGSLDFNFNPGPLATQSASLQLINFTSGGILAGACPCVTGDVSGQLPATLTFDNGTAFNDYFDDFVFGKTLSFEVGLYGQALSAPDGVSASGSTFAFSMFSDAAGTVPALTTDTVDGFAVTVDVNLDGTTTVTNFSSQTTVTPVVANATPELGSSVLAVTGIFLFVTLRWRRRAGLRGICSANVCLFALACTAAVPVVKAQSANTITEPTTEGVYYQVDSTGAQHPLENTTGKREGSETQTLTYSVQGERSTVRFPENTSLKFIVKVPANSHPRIYQYLGMQGQRTITAKKVANGKLALTSGKLIQSGTEQVGNSSYLLTPNQLLAPGEYCIGRADGNPSVGCFGVDASNGSMGSSQAQSQSHVSGSHAMTNDDVIKMVSAGLSPDVISSAIRQATDHAFDLSVDGLIILKQKKVPDPVIATMQSSNSPAAPVATPTVPSAPATQAQSTSPSPALNVPLSVPLKEDAFYYVNSDGKLAPLRAESWSILGNGTEQTSHVGRVHLRIFGAKSPLRFPNGDVTIVFRLCKKSVMNGAFANNCAVSDVVFERWESVQGAREAEIAPRRGRGVRRDPDPGQFDVVTKEVGERTYSMKPAEPLIPGEYCINYNSSGLKYYCFGVDPAR